MECTTTRFTAVPKGLELKLGESTRRAFVHQPSRHVEAMMGDVAAASHVIGGADMFHHNPQAFNAVADLAQTDSELVGCQSAVVVRAS